MKDDRNKMQGPQITGSDVRTSVKGRRGLMHRSPGTSSVLRRLALPVTFLSLAVLASGAQAAEGGKAWVASWTAAQQGAFVGPTAPAALAAQALSTPTPITRSLTSFVTRYQRARQPTRPFA